MPPEKGVERQFRYNCELCDVCMGYRSTPFEDEAKFIYVFPEAVATKSAATSRQSEGDVASLGASAGGGPASGVGAGPRQDAAAESAPTAQAEGDPPSANLSRTAEEEGSGIAAGSGGLALEHAAEDACRGADAPSAPLEIVPSPLQGPPPKGAPDPQLA
eukprot:SM000050S16973  [mRNA]  locus=s50:82169:83267:- [translate_table: standard]